MKSAAQYLDDIKELHQCNDSEAGRMIGITRQAVSNYRNSEQKGFDDEVAIKVARVLDIDPLVVVADMHEARAKSKDQKQFWRKLGSAAAMLIFCLTLQPQRADAHSIVISLDNYRSMYYAQLMKIFTAWYRRYMALALLVTVPRKTHVIRA